jgi:hypothetical protein
MVESLVPHMSVAKTQAGVPWFLQLTEDTRRFALTWAAMSKSDQDGLISFYQYAYKQPIVVMPFVNSQESESRSTEVYQVYTTDTLDITINRDHDRHGGLVLIETPRHLSVS